MHKSVLRSTPFRLTLALGLAFLLALALAGMVAFSLINDALYARLDRDIMDTYSVIEQSFVGDDLTDLADLVTSHTRASVGMNEVFRLEAPDGSQIAGNLPILPASEGWATVAAPEIGLAARSDTYRIFSGPIGQYRLAVGVSLTETNAIGWIVLTSLAWTMGALVLVLLLVGLATAIRGQRRLDSVAETLERVSRGQLDARIPLSTRNDDIDALAADVNGALDRLAALVEGMRQVSVDIAHELKTPLNRLSISLDNARDASDGQPEVLALLDEARHEVHQVNSIFEAMLRIAQIESGARRARFAPVDLGTIAERVTEAYEPVANERSQTLELALSPSAVIVPGDKDLLTQAVANLVENAIRHCPEGSAIRLAVADADGSPRIVVSDDGPGIPDGDKLRVFDRLYRVEKSRTTPGNGLGLSLVKAVADLHGATVTLADNQPGLRIQMAFVHRE
ncbi:sensor histidine kinase [Paradevosia shaoguanensis]|uniref:histidine kinase n=1 Tax=Paradevosia shaoguanensis TaxID=1335043 RepID=A0AA41QLS1_9HYPH|nr:ATP-binding protein [Paradevosia shaoguanensis]MCF1741676.1 HAMP domain-containing histidine kinase [Paradevosia shaoguanensis]MCI0126159.1 HAMP domain-containing histidine kinase [Paradevosia shaoguanensis]